MARKKRQGSKSVKALSAAYAALQSEVERRVDSKKGEGAFQNAVARLVSFHSTEWFSTCLADRMSGAIPDPLGREEKLVEIVEPWIEQPAVAFITGNGTTASALGLSKVVAPPSPLRELGCYLFGLEVLGDSLHKVDIGAFKTIVCIDVLKKQAERFGIVGFLAELTKEMKSGSKLIIVDSISYQDDAVENLVALDFEIHELKSVGANRLVALLAER